jgi:hypothetical protein
VRAPTVRAVAAECLVAWAASIPEWGEGQVCVRDGRPGAGPLLVAWPFVHDGQLRGAPPCPLGMSVLDLLAPAMACLTCMLAAPSAGTGAACTVPNSISFPAPYVVRLVGRSPHAVRLESTRKTRTFWTRDQASWLIRSRPIEAHSSALRARTYAIPPSRTSVHREHRPNCSTVYAWISRRVVNIPLASLQARAHRDVKSPRRAPPDVS